MALEVKPLQSRVQITLDMGTDEEGRRISRSRTLSRVHPNATDQDIYDTVDALFKLQTNPVTGIRKIAQSELVNA